MISSMIPVSYFFFVIITALSCQQYWFHDAGSEWIIWSALSLTLVNAGFTFFQRIMTLLLTGLTILISVSIAYLLLPYFAGLAFYLVVATIFLMAMINRYPAYYLPILLVNFSLLFVLTDFSHPPPISSVMTYLVLGITIVMLFQLIFYFRFTDHERYFYIKKAIFALIQLNEDMFNCFLAPHYQENLYFFERRLHFQKVRFMKALASLKQLQQKIQKKNADEAAEVQGIILKLSLLFSTLLDCAQLRKRIKDPHIFSTCERELHAVAVHISQALRHLLIAYKAKKYPDSHVIRALSEKIKQLEAVDVHVLRVILREPVVFLLFISSLKALNEEMAAWSINVQLPADAQY